jgi:hypothetical protein
MNMFMITLCTLSELYPNIEYSCVLYVLDQTKHSTYYSIHYPDYVTMVLVVAVRATAWKASLNVISSWSRILVALAVLDLGFLCIVSYLLNRKIVSQAAPTDRVLLYSHHRNISPTFF